MPHDHSNDDESIAGIARSIRRHSIASLAKPWETLVPHERLVAVAMSVREKLAERWVVSEAAHQRADRKRVCYLSMEFLIGRLLAGNLENLGLRAAYREAVASLGASLEELEECEVDAALGNGGLGRLAACFLESFATLGFAGYGYGINYEYGLFKQEIDDGYQREKPDNWLRDGSPWEIAQPAEPCMVPIHGRIEHASDRSGNYNPMWLDWRLLIAIPHDVLVPGYGGRNVTSLRLFSARASRDFDIRIFNAGDYIQAVEQKIASETVSKILYPSDEVASGKELRLIQEYFLVACSVRDILRRFERTHSNLELLPSKVAIQMNDTHPALAVCELMRILIDEKDLPWPKAWEITRNTLSYTNHTLAPEALERWSVPMLERVLPRHLQIIYEINHRLLADVNIAFPNDADRARNVSLLEESEPKHVRMTHLAIAGSHAVNGVSEIHTQLIKQTLVPDLYAMWPERFHNVTNGVTPRAWLLKANPGLAALITRVIGDGWITDLERLRALELYAEDAAFVQELLAVKRANKQQLGPVITSATGMRPDPASLFDVQVKRMHGYKRQLLNLMHVVHEYLRVVEDGQSLTVPRTYIFAGKAAPGYLAAKATIKLICEVARVINADPRAKDWLRVAFIPDYRVSLAERIIPAADLSEQISTAGTEASGTGNMKLTLNGALTIGTRDGANIELCEAVGEEHMFMFGLDAREIAKLRGAYHPRELCQRDPRLPRVVAALASNRFCPREPELFAWVKRSVLEPDDAFFHLADLASYIDTHERVGRCFRDPRSWGRSATLNVARAGRFSSDRAIREYARNIWQLER